MRQGRYQPKDAYGIRLDGEHYQLDGQPPVAQPTKNSGAPLVDVAKANAAAREQAWQEMTAWASSFPTPEAPGGRGASAPGASRLFGLVL